MGVKLINRPDDGCVSDVSKVNSMAPFNGAVAGTFPGLEAGVGIGFQPRILSYGAVSSGVGPSEDPESWLIPLECARVLEITGGSTLIESDQAAERAYF